ncbi:MAG: NADPH-dependent FMN reductase [Oscillatoriales cyanobacterium C42_A2020_001]|nr:NADPH-dependent FMN reductase [Leptolyngbyaceae cyanobacterium C42_A2020_001]
MTTILAIAGSPTYPSCTYNLLEYSAQQLQIFGIQTEIVSVRDIPAEVLAYGQYDSPALEKLKQLLEQAQGVIISTPIYKAAYTGVLKAFLDLLPQKALLEKTILPIATGGTIAHLLTIDYALKPVLSELGARRFITTVYAIDKQIQRQDDSNIHLEAELEQRLQQSLQELVKTVQLSKITPETLPLAS